MSESKHATLESQLEEAICEVEDTEEMFWLRELDDYQSLVTLGNALSAQYRFKDAINIYEKARLVKPEDPMIYIRLGGANLTLFRFEEARIYYENALQRGASEKAISYPMGIWHYLKGDYQVAANYFLKCLPCDGEMKIAVIYWHTLATYKGGLSTGLLDEYKPDMDVGHHIAYKEAVSVFSGECEWQQAHVMRGELDEVVMMYGISVYLEFIGNLEEASKYREEVLKRKSVWPCVAYLAAHFFS